ncbi:alpha/beta-hydrolase [Aspergillus insuetus]
MSIAVETPYQGRFSDIIGLTYRYGSVEGEVSAESTFPYEKDKPVGFYIANLKVGEALGKALLSISDLLPAETAIFDARLINRARLLYSLSPAQGLENPIVIDNKIREIVGRYAGEVNLDSPNTSDLDEPLARICAELGHLPKTVSHTRNHLRREAAGFKVMRDMEIPTQGGNSIFADVYLPLGYQKRYPVLISCTLYGRRVFYSGPDLAIQDDIVAFEKAEDDWHSTPAGHPITVPRESWGAHWEGQRGFENIATFNTFTYVPRGYAMVKIDPSGVSQTPGTRGVLGGIIGEYYDAVEWAASQTWSNGNVAMVGSSYGANTQWPVAALKPKGLKCFVPYATDIDTYREAAYTGGIPTSTYLTDWYARVRACSPKWGDQFDLVEMMKSHPFYDALWEMAGADADTTSVPCFLAASQIFMIHGRGAYEAWRRRGTANTFLQLVDCDYYPWPSREASGKIIQFLDHYMKSGDHPPPERVGIQVRLGSGKWYWRKEKAWPVPGIQYQRWYLNPDGALVTHEMEEQPERKLEYSTKVRAHANSGVTFTSAPFEEDVEFAGHFSATLSISSSTTEADVVVSLWPIDADGKVVRLGSKNQAEPLAKGFLRASHRKTDPSKTLPERPWHTHTEADNSPLTPNEVVKVEVELYPAAARIQKSWRLRVDITPSEHQPGIPGYSPPDMRTTWGETHEEGTNAIHVGSPHVNYVLCPVVPVKYDYPAVVL